MKILKLTFTEIVYYNVLYPYERIEQQQQHTNTHSIVLLWVYFISHTVYVSFLR